MWNTPLRQRRWQTLTSVPIAGWGPEYTSSGGGPPYFLCPVVTSKVYPVLSRRPFGGKNTASLETDTSTK